MRTVLAVLVTCAAAERAIITPSMVAAYRSDGLAHRRHERDVVETLVNEHRGVRSVHFHWLLPFPGTRTAEQIAAGDRVIMRDGRLLFADF